MVAFSDWLRDLFDAKVERKDSSPARAVRPASSGRVSAKPQPPEPYVYKQPYKAPVDLGRRYPEGQIPRTPAARAVSHRPPKNPTAIGIRQLNPEPSVQRADPDDWQAWGAEAEIRRAEALGQKPRQEVVDQLAEDRRPKRTPRQEAALKAAQELDAMTRDRIDQEFAAEQRVKQLGMTTTLTPEQYAALSPRQQAAVQFNTGLIAAGRADAETGGVDATRDYLARFNITRDEKELSSFLRLDDLVSDSILRKLDDLTARHDSASSLRWARGDEKAAGDSARFLRARGSSDAAAEALAQLLTTTGNRSFGATDTRPGFGQGARDEVIREVYGYMIDSRFNYTPQDIAGELQSMNQQAGTDVSTDELWEYLRANVDAVDYHRAGNNEATLPHPTESPYDKAPLTPLDVAEIRRRYGL